MRPANGLTVPSPKLARSVPGVPDRNASPLHDKSAALPMPSVLHGPLSRWRQQCHMPCPGHYRPHNDNASVNRCSAAQLTINSQPSSAAPSGQWSPSINKYPKGCAYQCIRRQAHTGNSTSYRHIRPPGAPRSRHDGIAHGPAHYCSNTPYGGKKASKTFEGMVSVEYCSSHCFSRIVTTCWYCFGEEFTTLPPPMDPFSLHSTLLYPCVQ